MNAPQLSVVLPSYRCAGLVERSLAELAHGLNATPLAWEAVVVDDGGGDFPAGWSAPPNVRLFRLPRNHGKGAAVRYGMLAAKGKVRVFTDADLPYGVDLLPPIVELIDRRGFHVVMGDRTLSGSSYHLEIGWKRRVASSLFSALVGRLVTGGFFDTQCGLKGFRGDVAERLFRLARVERFACDVEMIYLALYHRLDIKRIPVRLRRNETSTVRVGRDGVRMVLDVLGIKMAQLRRSYEDRGLSELTSTEFELRYGSHTQSVSGDAVE